MMARSGMAFPAGLRALMMVLLLLVILLPHAFSRKQDTRDNNCPPSSCGNILNISNPFRLTSDPSNCGDQSFLYWIWAHRMACGHNPHIRHSICDWLFDI
ncbi:uncharacterized protein LOC108997208 isoform X2 [Juglans regia]|uniref:Uncharacterized protein LOC108997208 isoform X2 n=1 Tax=Juglans regia TaxID=51240 RepID=A0A6P9EB31_JUGRE|nr:uncharacterized protein LOC108997208 isoform X2 [Juglans regia]